MENAPDVEYMTFNLSMCFYFQVLCAGARGDEEAAPVLPHLYDHCDPHRVGHQQGPWLRDLHLPQIPKVASHDRHVTSHHMNTCHRVVIYDWSPAETWHALIGQIWDLIQFVAAACLLYHGLHLNRATCDNFMDYYLFFRIFKNVFSCKEVTDFIHGIMKYDICNIYLHVCLSRY